MLNRSRALVAGLSLAFTLGAASAPAAAFAQPADQAADSAAEGAAATDGGVAAAGTSSDAPDGASAEAAVPAEVDRLEAYQGTVGSSIAAAISPLSAARATLQPVSDEMKYFTLYESGKNYDQGFSYGDGYNALGYYQFDRRHSLVSFMRYCVGYDPSTFSMFNAVLERAYELSDARVSMYDAATGRLTDIGELADSAWHAAYAANPTLFAALQDEYAISNYYRPTESWLASRGISMEGRADCVKGLVWSLTNLFGVGGVHYILGPVNLTNDMTDREMVNAIVDAFPQALADYLPDTPYYQSYVNRYEKERATCLAYIAEDEAAAGATQPDDDAVVDEPAGDDGAQGDVAGDAGTDGGAADEGATDGNAGSNGGGAAGDDGAGNGGSNGIVSGGDSAGNSGSNGIVSGGDDAGNNGSGDDVSDGNGSDNNVSDDGAGSTNGSGDASDGGSASGGSSSNGGASDNGGPNSGSGSDSNGTGSEGSAGGGSNVIAPSTPELPAANGSNGVTSNGDDASGNDSTDDGSDKKDDDESDKKDDDESKDPQKTEDPAEKTDDDGKTTPEEDPADPKTTPTPTSGGDDAPADAMPHTGDLVTIGVLASASLATFGATSIYAGKTHARRDGAEGASSSDDAEA